ncbi:MAG: hypothetical protein WCD53_18950 [Microcoleus sp.]|jgi:hypothetical protein|nr:hypothetical protein [Tychonema bourrellyi]MDQ2098715.1 hypothetical protein [Tychonema bourrellyi B0820]
MNKLQSLTVVVAMSAIASPFPRAIAFPKRQAIAPKNFSIFDTPSS